MRWTIALSLSLMISAAAWAGDAASLTTAGTVWTNAVLLPSGTTVHDGDRVRTDRASAAVISSRSTGRVEVREQSAVSLGEGEVVLHEGVVATSKAAVHLDGVEIVPSGKSNALVVVAKRNEQMLIAAYRGGATIRAPGFAPLLLGAGQYATPAAAGAAERNNPDVDKKANGDDDCDKDGATPAGTDDDDDDGCHKGGAVPAGTGAAAKNAGWTVGSLSHGQTVGLVAGLGAAAVGGTVAGFALLEKSPSPSTN
ncbi:MAG: hypothetical protein O2968_22405 [Acidobacteria bacterium]|nr:hypothetical protein [Acidobacteriota bacterium]